MSHHLLYSFHHRPRRYHYNSVLKHYHSCRGDKGFFNQKDTFQSFVDQIHTHDYHSDEDEDEDDADDIDDVDDVVAEGDKSFHEYMDNFIKWNRARLGLPMPKNWESRFDMRQSASEGGRSFCTKLAFLFLHCLVYLRFTYLSVHGFNISSACSFPYGIKSLRSFSRIYFISGTISPLISHRLNCEKSSGLRQQISTDFCSNTTENKRESSRYDDPLIPIHPREKASRKKRAVDTQRNTNQYEWPPTENNTILLHSLVSSALPIGWVIDNSALNRLLLSAFFEIIQETFDWDSNHLKILVAEVKSRQW